MTMAKIIIWSSIRKLYSVKRNVRKKGENIGYVGPKYLSDGKLNGYTTGPHLHFTIFLQNGKTTNPLEFSYQEKE